MLLLLACTGTVEPTPGPPPWQQLEAAEPELRLIWTTPLSGVGESLHLLERRPMGWVSQGQEIALLDARWQHDPRARCLPDRFDMQGEQGDCPEGQTSLRRGIWEVPPEALALDHEGLRAAVVSAGTLYVAELDLMAGNPLDWLRLDEGIPLEVVPSGVVAAAFTEEGLRVGGDAIWQFDLDGDLLWIEETPVTDLNADHAVASGRLEGAWHLDGETLVNLETLEEATLSGALGPFAVDGARIWYAVEGGLQLAGGDLVPMETPVDVGVTPAHEVLVLHADRVEVRLDEAALRDGQPALRAYTLAFAEKPKSPIEDLPCEGELSVTSVRRDARESRCVLDDLPGEIGLGVTPHLLYRSEECLIEAPVSELWEAENTALGVLFHEDARCDGNPTCYDEFLTEQIDRFPHAPRWVSGMSPNADAGDDWVEAIVRNGFAPIVPFYPLSAHPEVPHLGDPRSKESYALDYAEMARPLYASSAWALDADGPVGLFPGEQQAAFSMAGCANLLLRECQVLGAGDGNRLGQDDLAQLHLSLFRALAARGQEGTWSFHLPDIGSWNLTEGCTVQDRLWTGDCDGAAYQGFLMEVHARYALNDLVRWTSPSEL